MFLNRVPKDREYSITRATDLIIHSLIHACLLESPKRTPPTHGEKHKVTVRRAPRTWKVYILWRAAWFCKGIINNTSISAPVPCSPLHDTFHLSLGRQEPH